MLEEQLLASGQVRFFGMSDWLAEGAEPGNCGWCPGLTGAATTVRVQRRIVDAKVSGGLDPGDPHPAI